MLPLQVARNDEEDAATEARTAAQSVLSIRHLSKSFGPIAALKDISLDIGSGQVPGICGENGAGKSTLVKILTGVYQPDEGTILVGGEPANISTPRQAQERGIAIVSQELSLCPDLSVEDNIWLGSLRVPFLHNGQSCASGPLTRWRCWGPSTSISPPRSRH